MICHEMEENVSIIFIISTKATYYFNKITLGEDLEEDNENKFTKHQTPQNALV